MKKKDCMRRNIVFCLVPVVLLALLLAGCGKSLRTGTGPALQAQAGGFGGCGKKSGPDVQEEQADEQKDSADGEENTAPGGDQAPADAGDDSYSPAQTGTEPSADPNVDSADQNTAVEPAANTGVGSQAQSLTAARQNLEITSQPESADVKESESAVFEVRAKGEGLNYQWQCRESADKAWRKSLSAGSTEPSLTVEGKKEHSGFQFRCVVSDDDMSIASDAATLYVLAITKHPTDENVKVGKTATFSARASGRDLSYTWQRYVPSEKEWKKYGSDNTSPVLKVEDARTGWNGCKYRCKITDGAGNIAFTNPAILYVLGVTENPVEKNIRTGSSTFFKVAATGKNIKYQWQTRAHSDQDWHNSGGEGTHTSVLKLNDVSVSSNGRQLRCKITDADGHTVYSDRAKLYVLGISKDPETQYVISGHKASFHVSATGKNLKYQWERWSPSEEKWANSQLSTGHSSTLVIDKATSGLNGYRFRCKVTDAAKRVVHSKGASLSTLVITKNPSAQNVKSGGTAVFRVAAKGLKLKYKWEARESTSAPWRGSISSGNTTNTLKVPASTAKHGFRFRCRVTDPAGNTVYSRQAALIVPGIRRNPTAQRIKAGSTAVFSVKAIGLGLKYSWQVKESSNHSWRSSSSPGHTTNVLKVKGKTGHHGFLFRCKVTDSKGRVFYSKAAGLYVLGIVSQPQDQYEDVGHTAVFRVRATGCSKYQWQYYAKGSGWKNSAASGNKSSTLKVKATAGRNGFRFRCRLKDSKGNVVYTKTVNLHVYNSEQLFFQNY